VPQDWSSIHAPQDRPTLAEAAHDWYQQASSIYKQDPDHANKPVPMIVIATAGGGIRAAYWTATVLERLEADFRRRGQALENLLFGISGVSGGSVGAMDYVAALHARAAKDRPYEPTDFLKSDFLAAPIASLVFVDGPSNFLPDLGQTDRGTALEHVFEKASRGYLGYSFLSFFPDRATAVKHWRPLLLLNATHEETGRRIIGSNIKIDRGTFLDSFDEFQLLGSDMRASTVVHNSARFTYVSPAGKLELSGGVGFLWGEKNRGYVIDGGYFENYGASTATELASEARTHIEKEKGTVKLIILQISSDPSLTKERTRVRTRDVGSDCVLTTAGRTDKASVGPNFLRFVDSGKDQNNRWEKNDGEDFVLSYLNEAAAPLLGVTAVREAHGTLADAELASSICAEQNDARRSGEQEGATRSALKDPLRSPSGEGPTTMPSSETSASALQGNEPLFVHVAMCDRSENNQAPIVPPLGWVLSRSMQERFGDILKDCGNASELERLEREFD
jgi:hypothetical protein